MIIRKATLDDVDEVTNLINLIGDNIKDKELYEYSKEKNIYASFIECGFSAVAIEDGVIVGCFLTYITSEDIDSLYRELDYSPEFIDETILMENCVVKEEFRGFGLQKKMLQYIEGLLTGTSYRRRLCTVHPRNIYSLNNMEEMGYRVAKQAKLYGGKDRYILEKILGCWSQ